MPLPKCECFKENAERMELLVYQLSCGALLGLDTARRNYGMCDEAMPYLSLTLITLAIEADAGFDFEDPHGEDAAASLAAYEKILTTLIDRVRQRSAELIAWDQRLKMKETNIRTQ